jgi:signal transduction histidine kinase
MLLMINDILFLSKVKAGSILGEVKVVELARSISEDLGLYKEQAISKGLEFILEIPDQEINIRIDIQALKLIISNLISNAIKYTDHGSIKVILLKLKKEQKAVIEIKDTGIGIPKEDHQKLFTEFFRASNVKKSEIDGTGVGLSGVKDLVERFYGEMDFESRENEGSQFTIKLPLYEE